MEMCKSYRFTCVLRSNHPMRGTMQNRRCRGNIYRALILIGLVMGYLSGSTPSAFAQSLVQVPAPQSPHWSHINVFAYARALFLANVSPSAYQWYTSHLDAVEVHGNGPTVRAKNPTAELFSYQIDLTAFSRDNLSGVPEEVFLHFAEPTVLTFYTLDRKQIVGSASILGCPEGTPIAPGCRVQTHLWNDRRFVLNPQSAAFRTWKAGKLLGSLNVYGFSVDTSRVLWIDEHAPGFSWPLSFGYQTVVQSGGGIREFSGQRPGDVQFESAYADAVANWLTVFSAKADQAGKKVLINANENALHPWLLPQVKAVRGMSSESKHRPDGFAGPADYQRYLNLVSGLTTAGGRVDLHGIWCYTGPAGYTAGNYGTPAARYRMWRLASYYQFKEPVGSAGMVYFNVGFCSDERPTTDQWTKDQGEWLLAYQVDVGKPLGATVLYQQGTAGCPYQIFGRSYSKALILVRPQDSSTCTSFGDATAVTVTLSAPVQLLMEDGTLSPPVSSVKVRNAEAIIAYQATKVDATPPATKR
jgi:hypothetical protein